MKTYAFLWISWVGLNIADLVLSNAALRAGVPSFPEAKAATEGSLFMRFLTDTASFGVMKVLMPPLIGALLVVRKQKWILAVLTGAMALVVAYNLFWVVKFNLW